MEPTAKPRIKVCCISSVHEAWTAIRAGASALGLVSAMPSGPGVIGDALIAEVAARVPPGVASFLLTCATDADAIVRQQRTARVNTLQLVDAVPPDVYPVLRAELPGVALVQVIHVRGPESIDEARAVAPRVDALLLDSGNPSAAVKELGGTGRVHDWEVSRRIREARSTSPSTSPAACARRTWPRPSPAWAPSAWTCAAACGRTAASIPRSSPPSSRPRPGRCCLRGRGGKETTRPPA
jgi:phosphoribosylanthranilate isomerase